MQNKLFIGNLSFKSKEQDLKDLFEEFGTVNEVAIPTNRETGRSRGFAFVTFASEDAAKKALVLDGKDIGGRKIRVSIATGQKRTSGAPENASLAD